MLSKIVYLIKAWYIQCKWELLQPIAIDQQVCCTKAYMALSKGKQKEYKDDYLDLLKKIDVKST